MSTPILIYNGSPDPVGEVTKEGTGWASLHYATDLSYLTFTGDDSKDDAIQIVIDIDNETI